MQGSRSTLLTLILIALWGGVNAVLAGKLGLHNVEVLIPQAHHKFVKLVVFVPPSHVDTVRSAIGSAGGGWIGNYSDCTFEVRGKGAFRPLEGTNPYIGKTGELEMVEEIRLETILPANKVDHVIRAMLQAHPYEEVAYDLYSLENRGYIPVGLGRVGNLPEPMPFRELVQLVKKNLGLTSVRLGGGEPDKKVQRVAVCGGAGANLWSKARFAGAEILVTGDVGYHEARDMHAAGLGFIDAGHYGTEMVMLPVLRDYLTGRCKEEGINLELFLSESNYDPFVFI